MKRRLKDWIVFVAATVFATCALAGELPRVAAKTAPKQAPRKLDLRFPDITELFTPEQIQQMLANTRSDEDDFETVEVQGARVPNTPVVWGGLGAPMWAALHPTQAWRIIAPIPGDQIHAADVTPVAQTMPRDPFRP
jgi:hypothetical protein